MNSLYIALCYCPQIGGHLKKRNERPIKKGHSKKESNCAEEDGYESMITKTAFFRLFLGDYRIFLLSQWTSTTPYYPRVHILKPECPALSIKHALL